MNTYTADNIVVLDADQSADRFDWARAAELAARYKRPAEWVSRGLEACRRSRAPADYFIQRYLDRRPIPRNALVDAAFRELLTEQ